jgi:hypothetical protein
VLPTGTSTCSGGFNTSIGSYVAGPATLDVQLIVNGTVKDTKLVQVSLEEGIIVTPPASDS